MKAYYQGEVDYFCAIYAIINSCRIAASRYHRFSFKEGCRFYQYMMQYLYDRNLLLEVLYKGTCYDLMRDLLGKAREYMLENYNLSLHYKRPFKNKEISLEKAAQMLGLYLKKKDTACVMRLHNDDVGDHWSVVKQKARNKLKLFDSYFYPDVNIAKATWESYKPDGLTHIVKEGLIFIKVDRRGKEG